MNRPVHFEQAYNDPQKAIDFYEKIFDWKFQKWEGGDIPYWIVTTGEEKEAGINGGFMAKRDVSQPEVVNTIQVENIDEYIAKVKEAGAVEQMPKSPIPGMGYFAYYKDPGGVMFGIFQEDASAKME